MMQFEPDDLENNGVSVGGGQGPLPPAPAQPDPLALLKQQQDDTLKKKALLNVFGNIAQGLTDRPSAYELYTGKHSARPDAKGMFSAAADSIQDPMTSQEKAYAYLNAKRTNDTANETDKFKQSLKDENSSAAKAFKQTLIFSGADPAAINSSTAADLYTQGYSPSKMAEIKAKSNVEFGNQKAIHQMDNDASIKKFLLENGIKDREKKEDKTKENDNKDAIKLDETLSKGWAARGGQAGAVQAKINAAEAAEALFEQGKTQPGGLDHRQIEEAAQATARLLGGGTTASARVDALVPKSYWGNAQTMKEWLSNKPQGADMQKFTDRMAETVAREKALATDQRKQYQVESLAAHERLKKSNPELYNQILESKGLTPDSIQQYKAKNGGTQFTPDVVQYAKEHGITPEQAQNVKNSRTSNIGSR